MTRATLLSLLAHPAALSAPDVRALEELAHAFPYCQTAHLLLAKAAHDQDSMLAAQRLRRAATYAADRTRLRQLIDLPAPVAAAAPVAVETGPSVPPATAAPAELPSQPNTLTSNEDSGGSIQTAGAEYNNALEDQPDHVILPAPSSPAEATPTAAPEAATPETQAIAFVAKPPLAEAPELPAPEVAAPAAPIAEALLIAVDIVEPIAAEATQVPGEDAYAAPAETVPTPPPPADAATNSPKPTELPAGPAADQQPAAPADELPAQAPPIRPPVAAEAAHFEFGLAASEPAELTAYRLPELEAPTRATPVLPQFSGAPEVSYAPSEGSRLGFCLVPAVADPAAVPGCELPPAGEFFAPDALLLDFLAALPPIEPPRPSSLDLINSFLQRAPLASRRRAMPSPAMPDPEAQADLSLPSTRIEFDLVSENLAAILARQGKNERAIAVYEKLMAKYPEKMAYFAAQIESLRP